MSLKERFEEILSAYGLVSWPTGGSPSMYNDLCSAVCEEEGHLQLDVLDRSEDQTYEELPVDAPCLRCSRSISS